MNHDGGRLAYAPTKIISTWPKGSFAESVAVDSLGSVFVSLHTDQAVVRVDCATGEVTPFATFDLPVAGLVFDRNGALYVSGGHPGQAPGMLWRVMADETVSHVATLPEARFLNGMSVLDADDRLLVADSIGGIVYAVDPDTGAFEPWLSDDRLRPVTGDMAPGVNGVKFFGGHVYVSVTARDALYRAPVANDGTPGPLEVFAENLRADDFAFDVAGNLYIATHPAHSLVRLAQTGERTTLAVAQHGLLCSTAVAFGRAAADAHSVYVTTTGGTMILAPEDGEAAKLVRVDVGVAGHPLLRAVTP